MELSTEPLPRHWHDSRTSGLGSGSASYAYPASPTSFPHVRLPTTAILAQRRRSSAAHAPPACPPPNLPIPSVPDSVPEFEPLVQTRVRTAYTDSTDSSGRTIRSGSLAASPASSSSMTSPRTLSRRGSEPLLSRGEMPSALGTSSTSVDDHDSIQHGQSILISPPPLSSTLSSSLLPLQPSSRFSNAELYRHERQHSYHHSSTNSQLLSPPPLQPTRVPSPRRALTTALDLAREAVQIDAKKENPEDAVRAYRRSVDLLGEAMQRIRHEEGVEGTETIAETRRSEDQVIGGSLGRRRGKSVSGIAVGGGGQEGGLKRLQNIHNTLADRMNLLSTLHSIPASPVTTSFPPSKNGAAKVPSSSGHVGSASASPAPSPSNDVSDQIPFRTSIRNHTPQDPNYEPLLPITDYLTLHTPPIPSTPPRSPTLRRKRVLPSKSSKSAPSSPTLKSTIPHDIPEPPPLPGSSFLHVGQDITRDDLGATRSVSVRHDEIKSRDSVIDSQPKIRHSLRRPKTSPSAPASPTRSSAKRESHPLLFSPPPVSSSSSQNKDRTSLPASASTSDLSSPLKSPHVIPRPRGSSRFAVRPHTATPPVPPLEDGKINPTTSQGTIFQRRAKSFAPQSFSSTSPLPSEPSDADLASFVGVVPTPKPSVPPLPGGVGPGTPRSRATSQPSSRRPLFRVSSLDQLSMPPPPLPLPGPIPLPASVSAGLKVRKRSSSRSITPSSSQASLHGTPPGGLLSIPATPLPTTPLLPVLRNPFRNSGSSTIIPSSPLPPPPPPASSLLQPYHLMTLLRISMTAQGGGFVTQRLRVPKEVWCEAGVRLNNVGEKTRVAVMLSEALEELKAGAGWFDPRGSGSGVTGREEGEAWIAKLDEFAGVCDAVVVGFGRKLDVGEGFTLGLTRKKTGGGWGDRISRRFDRLTGTVKGTDTPETYAHALRTLFKHAQMLDEHTKAVLAHPPSGAYITFPEGTRAAVEAKLKRASEFFAGVVLKFVMRDLAELLAGYARRCERWLEE